MPRLPRKRRKTTPDERLTTCHCYEPPVSQRHHEDAVHAWGENKQTTQLCANCHEGVHIIERACIDMGAGKHDTPSIILMITLRDYWGADSPRFEFLCSLYMDRRDMYIALNRRIYEENRSLWDKMREIMEGTESEE